MFRAIVAKYERILPLVSSIFKEFCHKEKMYRKRFLPYLLLIIYSRLYYKQSRLYTAYIFIMSSKLRFRFLRLCKSFCSSIKNKPPLVVKIALFLMCTPIIYRKYIKKFQYYKNLFYCIILCKVKTSKTYGKMQSNVI